MGALIGLVFKIKALILSYYPRWFQLWSGNLVGYFLKLLGYKSKVIEANLKRAFPTDTNKREKLFTESYRHLGNLILEVFLVLAPGNRMRSFLQQNHLLFGRENWEQAYSKGKGVIFLSSHVGNWEIMSGIGALQKMSLMIVTKHLKPEWIHQAIEKGRLRYGVTATYEPKTMRQILTHLREGKTLGIVLDQYAGPPVGVRVPFLGVPVGTSSALAALSKRTGAPVLPVLNYRLPDGRFRIEIFPALDWIDDPNPQKELALNTAKYASVIEEHVRAQPGQWLWSHRRFKGDLSPLRKDEWEHSRPRNE